MEKIYNKLVRDNIPEIIKSNNGIPYVRKLTEEEFWEYLLKKDNEELEEVKNSTTKEEIKKELADKLELIKAMAEFNGFTLQDIINEAKIKREKRGGFQKRLLLEKVIENDAK